MTYYTAAEEEICLVRTQTNITSKGIKIKITAPSNCESYHARIICQSLTGLNYMYISH